MIKRFTAAAVALVLGVALSLVAVSAAQATPSTAPCMPSAQTTIHHDAVTHTAYQRYSYNPKKDHPDNPNDGTPPSTPLSDPGHWQANTTDYAGAGHGTDPIGSTFFRGVGHDDDNGSWFFWTGTTVVDKKAYDEVIPAVTCSDSTISATPLAAICNGTPVFTEAQFAIANATWNTAIDNTSGTHSRGATSTAGHLFASTSTNTASVTYTVPNSLGTSQSTNREAPCYTAPSTVTYETVVWSMPSPNTGSSATYPQLGVSQHKNEPTQTLDVAVPTTCGTQYQIDVYVQVNGQVDNTAAIDTMFAAGLAGPDGAQDGAYLAGAGSNPGVAGLNHAWKFVKNPDCQVGASVTPFFPAETAPSCDVSGALPALPTDQTGLTFSWAPDGLTMVASLQGGFTFEQGAATSKTYDAPAGATGYQSTNSEGLCYVPPTDCVVNTSIPWTTEDIAPVQGSDGLEFDGPHTAAMDTYQRVTAGNMQGLTGMTVTYTTGNSGFQALVVVEVDPHTDLSATPGVNDYATISSVTDVTDGTVNVQDGLWYTNKIAYGDQGGQGHPITWAAMTALMPQNTLLSAPSLHQQTQTGADAKSVVTSLSSSCGSTSFVPVGPEPKFTTTVDQGAPQCSPAGGGSYTLTTHYLEQNATWDATSASYTYTEAPHSYGKADTTSTVTVGTDVCPIVLTPLKVSDPTNSNETCSPDGLLGGVITVVITPHVSYSITDSADDTIPFNATTGKTGPLLHGTYTVAVTAEAGYSLTTPASYTLTVGAYDGECGQLVDHPIVTPLVTSVPLGCTTGGSYTLSNDLNAPTGVIWTVDGSPVNPGTYQVTSATTVHIHAAPNGPNYGFAEGQQQDWTVTFTADTSCVNLDTLALHDGTLATTGSDPTGLLVLAGFLALFGLLLTRLAHKLG